MVTSDMVKKAVEQGLPAIKDLLGNLSKEDCDKALSMMENAGVSKTIIETIKPLINLKNLFG